MARRLARLILHPHVRYACGDREDACGQELQNDDSFSLEPSFERTMFGVLASRQILSALMSKALG